MGEVEESRVGDGEGGGGGVVGGRVVSSLVRYSLIPYAPSSSSFLLVAVVSSQPWCVCIYSSMKD